MRLRFSTLSPRTQDGLRSPCTKLDMLPLAESERQEISAAFDEAEAKIKDAGVAVKALLELLEDRCAFIGDTRIKRIRAAIDPLGGASFGLSVQRCKMLKFGAARALK